MCSSGLLMLIPVASLVSYVFIGLLMLVPVLVVSYVFIGLLMLIPVLVVSYVFIDLLMLIPVASLGKRSSELRCCDLQARLELKYGARTQLTGSFDYIDDTAPCVLSN